MNISKNWIIVGVVFAALVVMMAGSMMVSKMLFSAGTATSSSLAEKNGVGLVEVKGMIIDSRETNRQLRYFLKKDNVKAVVLRVDSPGGVVAPSQEIYEEVKKFAARKKIVVSMGSMAASGGYYISAPANVIYANPGTITASIGVLIKLSNIEGLLDKVGIKSTTIKTGQYKDAGSPERQITPEDRAMFQAVIDSTHQQFIRAVSEGRKIPQEEVRQIADGRILSGEQAKAYKLVDKLGTLQDAIEEAGRLGGIKGEPEVILPPKKKVNYLDLFAEGAEDRFQGALGKIGVGRGLQLMYE